MNTYKLLTPGPLTTTDTVKQEMLVDRCTWDDDYKAVTQKIRRQLLELAHVSEDDYTAVLMQGSGTFGVESVLTSVVGDQDKVLICSNGAYGKRMTDICTHSRIPFVHYAQDYDKVPDAAHMAQLLAQDSSITHVAMVHSETTSGILNDIQSVGKVVRDAGRTFIVDAMSSFGGVDIPVSASYDAPTQKVIDALVQAGTMDNVLLTPHAGSNTLHARNEMARAASRRILDRLAGRIPQNLLNPEALAHEKAQ